MSSTSSNSNQNLQTEGPSESNQLPPSSSTHSFSPSPSTSTSPQHQQLQHNTTAIPSWKHLDGFEELSQSWPDAHPNPNPEPTATPDASVHNQIHLSKDDNDNGNLKDAEQDEYSNPIQNHNQSDEKQEVMTSDRPEVGGGGSRNPSGDSNSNSNSQSTAKPNPNQNQQTNDTESNHKVISNPKDQSNLPTPPNLTTFLPWSDKPRFPTGFSRPSSDGKGLSSSQQESVIEEKEEVGKEKEGSNPSPSPRDPKTNFELQAGPSNPNNRKPSGNLSEIQDGPSTPNHDDGDASLIDEDENEQGEKENEGEVGYQEAIRRKLGDQIQSNHHQDRSRSIDLGSDQMEDENQDLSRDDSRKSDQEEGGEDEVPRMTQTPLPPRRRDRERAEIPVSRENENDDSLIRSTTPSPTRTVTMTMTMNSFGDEDQDQDHEQDQEQRQFAEPTPLRRRRRRSNSFNQNDEEEEEEGMSSFASDSEEDQEDRVRDLEEENSLPYRIDEKNQSQDEKVVSIENQSLLSQSPSQSFVDAPSRHSFSQSRIGNQENRFQQPQPPSPSRSSSSSEAKLRGPSDVGIEEQDERDNLNSPVRRENRQSSEPQNEASSSRNQIEILPSKPISPDPSNSITNPNEETFIHKEDVSDLPPMFQPQWKTAASPTKDLLNKKIMLESMWEVPENQKAKGKEKEKEKEKENVDQKNEMGRIEEEKREKSPPRMLMGSSQPKTHILPSANKGKMYLSEEARRARDGVEVGSSKSTFQTSSKVPSPNSSPRDLEPVKTVDLSRLSVGQQPHFGTSTPTTRSPAIFKFSSNSGLIPTPSGSAKPLRIFRGNTPANMAKLRGKVARAAERESQSPVKQFKGKQTTSSSSPSPILSAQEEWSNGDRERKRTRLDKPPSGLRRGSSASLSPQLEKVEEFENENHREQELETSPSRGGRDYVKAGASFMAKRSAYAIDTLSFTPSPSQRDGDLVAMARQHSGEEAETDSNWEDEEEDDDEEEEEEEEEGSNEAEARAVEEELGQESESKSDEVSRSRVTRSGRDAPTPNASRDAAIFYSAPTASSGTASPTRMNERKIPGGRGEESLARRAERRERESGAETSTKERDLDSQDLGYQHVYRPDSSQNSIPTPPHLTAENLSTKIPISISHSSFPSSSSTKSSFLRRSAIGKSLKAEKEESPRKTLRLFNAAYAAEEEFREEKARDDLIEQREEEERLEKWRRKRQEEEENVQALRMEEERRSKAFKASWAAQNRAEMERNSQQLMEEELANLKAPGPQMIQVHQSFSGNPLPNRSAQVQDDGSISNGSFVNHGRIASSGSISSLPAAKTDAQMLPPSESAIESPTRSNRLFAVTPSQASQAFRSASNENLQLQNGSERNKSSPLFGAKRLSSGSGGGPIGITNILPDDPMFVEEADRIATENRRVWDSKSKSWVKDRSRSRKGISNEAFRQSQNGLVNSNQASNLLPSSGDRLSAGTVQENSSEGLGEEGRGRHHGAVSQTVLNRLNHQDNGTDTSDSTSPFRDFSSFGTNVEATHSRGESQTPPAQTNPPPSYFNSNETPPSTSIKSAPIPSVAISAPTQPPISANSSAPASLGRAQIGIPKSGSTLRNELRFSSRETTRDSAEDEAGIAGGLHTKAPVLNKPKETTPEKLHPGGSQQELEDDRLITPSKPGGPGSTSVTPQPPRSILKSAPGSTLRPGSNYPVGGTSPLGNSPNSLFGNSPAGRSISFADGRKTGRMLDSNLKEIEAAFSPNGSRSENADKTAVVTNLFQQLADLSFGEGQYSASLHPSRPSPPEISFTGAVDSSTPPRSGATLNRSEILNGGSPWNNRDQTNGDLTYLTEASFAVARDQMLVLLTDVHPWVEEWEKLEKIDLRRRKVGTLVRLKDFLPSVEEVQVDHNEVSFFSGLPSSVRLLTASHNKISSVTSFRHLPNLETLDLSNNDIDSLSALSGLSHLRELRLDNNNISSVEGIESLTRLVSLSLRGNQIQSFDASQTKWRKLLDLDFSHNSLLEVNGLSTLHSLKTLNFDHNQLEELDLESLPHLRVLRVCDNVALKSLDVLPVAKLRTLYADFCSIQTIDNLGALSKLQDFSLRMQGVAGLIWPAHELRDAKRLFFSGNAFPGGLPNANLGPASGLSSPLKFYNLVYLELASCQLTALPADLPDLAPNMRSLNADHNHFETLPPLQKMHRLKRLSLFGCGIRKLNSLTKALVGMEELQTLDVRCNPCSHGFYPPITIPGGPMSPSHPIAPSSLAPIPNPAVVQPDVAEEAAAYELEKEAEARRAIEMSFFNKRVPNVNSNAQHGYGSVGAASSAIYSASDERFSSTLPPHIARRRLLHRGMLAMACQSLTWLDGLMIDEQEVLHADEEITRSEMRQKRSRSHLLTDSSSSH